MKTLGLIGGTTWRSTIDYYRHLNQIILDKTGTNPPLLIHSIDQSLWESQSQHVNEQSYLEVALKLQDAGAKAIVICANSRHKVVEFVESKLAIPIIHIATGIGIEAGNLDLNSLGILGTKEVVEDNFIIEPLQNNYGLQIHTSDENGRNKVDDLIKNKLAKVMYDAAGKKLLIEEMTKLKEKGAKGIILGCTDFSRIISGREYELTMLDTTYLHARTAAEFILS